jgi:hypothetical protein
VEVSLLKSSAIVCAFYHEIRTVCFNVNTIFFLITAGSLSFNKEEKKDSISLKYLYL